MSEQGFNIQLGGRSAGLSLPGRSLPPSGQAHTGRNPWQPLGRRTPWTGAKRAAVGRITHTQPLVASG